MIGRNGLKIAKIVLRGSIIACPSLIALYGLPSGELPVFWENVPDGTDLPYITFAHFSGGYEKDRRYFEAVYEVRGQTANLATADKMETAIDELDYSWPVIPSGIVEDIDFTGVCAYDTIDSMLPTFSRYQVKNNTVFVTSQYYRLRLNLGDIS